MRRTFELEAPCPWCGPIIVDPVDVRCETGGRGGASGLAELSCPGCERRLLFPLDFVDVIVLRLAGAGRIEGPVPFELLEPHHGAPISADDILGVRVELDEGCCPQDELTNGSVR